MAAGARRYTLADVSVSERDGTHWQVFLCISSWYFETLSGHCHVSIVLNHKPISAFRRALVPAGREHFPFNVCLCP